MGRSNRKNSSKRKTSRPSASFDEGLHEEVSFDPDPPVASGHSSPNSSISSEPLLDRVPSMAAAAATAQLEDPEVLALGRYISRKPIRWSKLVAGNSIPFIEPLISYNRKMARISPRAFERTPQAQARRERAATMCPCRKGEPMEVQLPDLHDEQIPGPSGLVKVLHLKKCKQKEDNLPKK